MKKLEGNIVDVIKNRVYPGVIYFNQKILRIERNNKKYNRYIVPGFIDAHIHIESSMLVPSKFAELVIPHGTVAVISDPHEIANVLGVKGIEFMIKDSKKV
ncbi:MAG: amidohydrolase family protein, partial [Candidatus Nanoarchaeia archaeon]